MSSWKDYFTHNKRERNGTIVLAAILLGMITFLQLSKGLVANDVTDFHQYEDEVDAFYAEQETRSRHKSYTTTPELHEDDHAVVPQLFNFDPNNLPVEDWIKLGLTEKQANSIHNYERKGGQFRKKEDVAKMYVIDDELYQRLEPYISIPPRSEAKEKESAPQFTAPQYEKKWKPVIVNINTADSAALTQLRGVGPSYAKRIIKYRNMLGGFVHAEQLMEVYGMDQERYEGFIESVELTGDGLFQININKCEASALRNHPYISWNVANALVNYRKVHGAYETLEDIKKCDLVNDELYAKIVAYLSLQ